MIEAVFLIVLGLGCAVAWFAGYEKGVNVRLRVPTPTGPAPICTKPHLSEWALHPCARCGGQYCASGAAGPKGCDCPGWVQ